MERDESAFKREYLGEWDTDYGANGCCTADGYSRKPLKWSSRRTSPESEYKYEQQEQCQECGRPFSTWEPVISARKR